MFIVPNATGCLISLYTHAQQNTMQKTYSNLTKDSGITVETAHACKLDLHCSTEN